MRKQRTRNPRERRNKVARANPKRRDHLKTNENRGATPRARRNIGRIIDLVADEYRDDREYRDYNDTAYSCSISSGDSSFASEIRDPISMKSSYSRSLSENDEVHEFTDDDITLDISDDGQLRDDEGCVIDRVIKRIEDEKKETDEQNNNKLMEEDDEGNLTVRSEKKGSLICNEGDKGVEVVEKSTEIELDYAGRVIEETAYGSASKHDPCIQSSPPVECGQEVELSNVSPQESSGVPEAKKANKMTFQLEPNAKKANMLASKGAKSADDSAPVVASKNSSGDSTKQSSVTEISDGTKLTSNAQRLHGKSTTSLPSSQKKSLLSSPKIKGFFNKKKPPIAKQPEGILKKPKYSKRDVPKKLRSPRSDSPQDILHEYIANRTMRTFPLSENNSSPVTTNAPNVNPTRKAAAMAYKNATPAGGSITSTLSSKTDLRHAGYPAAMIIDELQPENPAQEKASSQELDALLPSFPEFPCVPLNNSIGTEDNETCDSTYHTAANTANTESTSHDEKRLLGEKFNSRIKSPVSDDECTIAVLHRTMLRGGVSFCCVPLSSNVDSSDDIVRVAEKAADGAYTALKGCYEEAVRDSFDECATTDSGLTGADTAIGTIDDNATGASWEVKHLPKEEYGISANLLIDESDRKKGVIQVGSDDENTLVSIKSSDQSCNREDTGSSSVITPVEEPILIPEEQSASSAPKKFRLLPSLKRKKKDNILDEDSFMADIFNEIKLEEESEKVISRRHEVAGDDPSDSYDCLPQGLADMIASAIAEEAVLECLGGGRNR